MLVVATAATAALLSAGYQSMSPTGQWFGRAFCRAGRGSRQIALTFDDGPNDPYTLKLLDVLSRHQVRATFFLIGRYVRERPDIVREVAERGHAIGNHTFSHPLLILEPSKAIRNEIAQCRETIRAAVGEHSNLFRPPWGGRRPGMFRMVRELGLEPVMWNISGNDWKAPSAEFIERRVRGKIRGGDVILLHDGGHAQFGADRSKTVEAVDRLLTLYKDQYEFDTIPQMTGSP
jgi:peptidoglycan/xylan/chitin deacetylase (PgdA/CDA1 family)